ncbi:unnamed protein product [Absidia cylindrospora]
MLSFLDIDIIKALFLFLLFFASLSFIIVEFFVLAMETWHWGLVGAGLALFFVTTGYLCHRYCRRLSQKEQQRIDHHQSPVIIIDGNEKTPPPYHTLEADHISNHHPISRSTTPNSLPYPYIITQLSAPPAQFFRDQTQSRWMSTNNKPSSPSFSEIENTNTMQNADWTDNNHRLLSLSPFLGHTNVSTSPSPSPLSSCSEQTRTPSPALAKLASSWSTWKRHA